MYRLQIKSINIALRIYYENPEIGNKEITELFGKMSTSTITVLKKCAKELMAKEGVKSFRRYTVNTKLAYKAWGIDVDDLEERRKKLIKLGFDEKVG